MKKVLDVCCGSRMFWFDKGDIRALFLDERSEKHEINDSSQKSGKRKVYILPDVQADFTSLPIVSGYFDQVVFDPPHMETLGEKSWMAIKYGRLIGDWKTMLRSGFSECFRVLRSGGTLIFKWNEYDIPLSDVLKLTNEMPLYGHRSGKHSKTHWVSFVK